MFFENHRKTAQGDVPVGPSPQPAGLPDPEMKPQGLGDKSGLVRLRFLALDADDLLQGHDIRFKALKDLGDPLNPVAPVHSPALVDIVGHHPKKSGYFLSGFNFRIRLLKFRLLGHRSFFHGTA